MGHSPTSPRGSAPAQPLATANPGDEQVALASQHLRHEKFATLGELTAGIAHELNNPIGYISSNLNTLSKYAALLSDLIASVDTLIDPTQRLAWQERLTQARWDYIRTDISALIDETRHGADHLKHVVTELKTLSRSTHSTEQTCADACMGSALTVLSHHLKHRFTVSTHLACPQTMTMVRAQIVQLIINLIHNAIQALGDAGGHLRVRSEPSGDAAILYVEDSGPGIPPGMRQSIFGAFFTTKSDGTGLGLMIARQIARAHGGDIQCDQSPDLGGARFTVTLRDWQGAP